ncbi:aminotransferase class III-fold pyridoxal phosphate-dependent enzyme [Alteraurantiacibacter aquimixticola]|uniref:Aminotransferase class III-fold pyridoxal phosphate-dependent enzyme n=2 Tax=Alteraurantiacibacter aquimixticola TaxID=2489173 RepID=A0A4T3F7G7_9SPHN|nr:aminotransferase class III-fold pyridoxal phosphate-dependent enzyme [Alteraurantiacibacter aquimixticola]
MARRAARLVPSYSFAEEEFFAADGAPDAIVQQRRAGFEQLAAIYRERFAKTAAYTAEIADGIPDIRFTSTYRVPFQFSPIVRENLSAGSFYQASSGVMLTDLDGNEFYDLTGSYGVNLLGVDAYRETIAEGAETAADLGPTLAGLHPVVADNVRRLQAISGLDAVSFHMSGTEAVMQAVRLARYHTGRTHLVRFAGAYHGWWDDVQPGVGNPLPAERTYTLADMSEKTLKVLASRKDIACVLVNPLQALHPNANAPGDSTLMGAREKPLAERQAYADWLARLAQTCRANGIVLIMDEVFTGFRLAARGACEYFGGIEPDMITYGKTLGGGLPVGVLCGKADLMKRFREDRPADICFARGTFNSHPYVMGAMDAFLRRMESDQGRVLYDGLDENWNARAAALNERLKAAGLPLRVANLGTIWTVHYLQPGRYHWMLQYYLRAEGLALSWVGTGRFIFSLAYGEAEFAKVADRFMAAAQAMDDDGWWWLPEGDARKVLRKRVVSEMLHHALR